MTPGIVLSHISFALTLFLLLPIRSLPAGMRFAFLAGAAVLAMFPVDGLSLAVYMRSLTGDLSITTLLWLGWCAGARIIGTRGQSESQHLQLALCFSMLALLLYPASLGLSMFDPYRLGYDPGYLVGFVFVISVALWLVRHYFGAALLTAATTVFMLDVGSPDNYWDFLIDPLLGLYCLSVIAWFVLQRIWRKLKGRFEWAPSTGVAGPAFQSPGKSLITSVTNFYSEDGIKNME